MATLTLNPSTLAPLATGEVSGAGLKKRGSVRVYRGDPKLDSSLLPIISTRATGKGSFGPDGITAGPTEGTVPITCHQIVDGVWAEVTRTTLTVKKPVAVAPPVAGFAFDAAALDVSFSDTSTGLPTAWHWDFGDGATSTAQNPQHTYRVEGSFAVTLLASNAGGQNGVTKTITVRAPIVIPFNGFANADAAVSPGGTVDVPAGTYKEKFSLLKQGVHWRGATGAILDYAGMGIPIQGAGFVLAGADIIFEGFEGKNSDGGEYHIDGDRVTVLNHKSHHHIQEAYVIHGQDATIKGGSITDCNLDGQKKNGSEQGAGKTVRRGARITGVYIARMGVSRAVAATMSSTDARAIAGQGAWWDSIKGTANLAPPGVSQGWEAELDHCFIEEVFYAGGFFEIGVGAQLHHNAVLNSGFTPSGSGYWGAGLLAASSSEVDTTFNVIAGCQSCFRIMAQDREDMPRNADGSKRFPDHIRTLDNVFIDPTLAGPNAATVHYEVVNVGAEFARNRFHGTVKVHWGRTTYTDLTSINKLPGGGGNAMISDAQRDTIMAAFATKDVSQVLAAAGIAA